MAKGGWWMGMFLHSRLIPSLLAVLQLLRVAAFIRLLRRLRRPGF